MRRGMGMILMGLLVAMAVGAPAVTARDAPDRSNLGRAFEGRQFVTKASPETFQGGNPTTVRELPALGPQTADIQVSYTGFSTKARAVFEAAVRVWESFIVSDQVIRVTAEWTPLEDGLLGAAGPTTYYLLEDDFLYPAALAEAICSCNGAEPFEIDAVFNSAESDWYLGTDGKVPSDKYDLFTLVLHEIGHGLGLGSSFWVEGSVGIWGYGADPDYFPVVYDAFVWSSQSGGVQLLSYDPAGDPELKTQLTDGSVFFNGPNVAAVLGGRARLFAPSPWSASNISHLDEATYGTGTSNGLMSPSFAKAEAIHRPGPVVLGMLNDIGWTTGGGPDVPANNDFADASNVTAFPFDEGYVNNSGATFQLGAGEPDPSCVPVDATIWYRIRPTDNYRIRVRVTPADSVDPVVAVWEGPSLGTLDEIGCADAAAAAGEELLFVDLLKGHTYYVQVGGFQFLNPRGAFAVNIRQEATSPAPPNNNFANAAAVTLNSVSNTNTLAATLQNGEPVPSCRRSMGKTVWYRYRPTTTRNVVVNTVGSGFDTVIAVYTGSSLGTLSEFKCNDDRAADSASKIKFMATANKTYYIQVAGYASAGGTLVFRLKTP